MTNKKRKKLEVKNPFTNLLDSLKEGKLGHNQIQIAYRAWIREGRDTPDAIKDLLAGAESKSGLLFGMFMSIRAVVGAMELAYRRGHNIGYDDALKVVADKDSYIKRLKKQILKWESKFDRLLKLFNKYKKNKDVNEIRRLRTALRKIKKIEEDCSKDNHGYNDVIYQACVNVLPAIRGKRKKKR